MENNMPQESIKESLSLLGRIQEFGLLGYGWMLILTFWAGTVKYLTGLDGEKGTLSGWITEVVVCSFVGVVSGMTCQYFGLDQMLTFIIVALSSHQGTRSLYIISGIIKKNFSLTGKELGQDGVILNSKGEDHGRNSK